MASPFEELRTSRTFLTSQFSGGSVPENFQEEYTEVVDTYFRRSLQDSVAGHELFRKRVPVALVAVGGYGRRELCLHSDIDLMILFDAKIPSKAKDLADELFFPLWDLGLDLGYAVRSIKDCVSLSKADFEVLTSLMDARFLCGNSPLYLSFAETLARKVVSKKAASLARWLGDCSKIRMEQFGDASYLLEPQLKEGIGGLRDYHHILWLAKAFFDIRVPRDLEYTGKFAHREYRELREHLEFVWCARNHLHHLSKRANDRLGFENQEEIAARMGFEDVNGFRGVEQFMGRLHGSMAAIKTLYRSFITSYLPRRRSPARAAKGPDVSQGIILENGEVAFESPTSILADPHVLVRIFEHSSLTGHPLSLEAARLVREFIFLLDDALRESSAAAQSFLGILAGDHAFEAMDQMYQLGGLEAYIPEFTEIRDRVEFDTYHIYPVGRHVLQTLKYLKRVLSSHDIIITEVFSEISDPQPLFLGALLHDIGKTGKNHAKRGATISRRILKRMGCSRGLVEDVAFLVKHHLLMAETATRRDLDDEKAVVQCALTIGTVKRLKMLYLLTWADSRATGPKAWNEWIANLVQELFFKILHILEKRELATPHAAQKTRKTTAEILSALDGTMEQSEVQSYLEIMTPRYFLNTSTPGTLRHIQMASELRRERQEQGELAFRFAAREDAIEGCWEITFLAYDRPGLFSDLAGVLALNNINILTARIYTWRDGTAVDIFTVTPPLDTLLPQRTWNKVRDDVDRTLQDRDSLGMQLQKKAEPSILDTPKSPPRPSKVVIDNGSSDFFTVIEVFADDRIGLLYLITRALYDLELDIRIAKIATKADQIADVFYVRDIEGQKILDEADLSRIQTQLLKRLNI